MCLHKSLKLYVEDCDDYDYGDDDDAIPIIFCLLYFSFHFPLHMPAVWILLNFVDCGENVSGSSLCHGIDFYMPLITSLTVWRAL